MSKLRMKKIITILIATFLTMNGYTQCEKYEQALLNPLTVETLTISCLPDKRVLLFKNLKQLNVQINSSETLKFVDELSKIKSLKGIMIYAPNVISIDDEIFKDLNLNSLTISCGRITQIPKSIERQEQLVYLNLNTKALERLELDCKSLVSLEKLEITSNHLTSIQLDWHKLLNLEFLTLYCENLSVFPIPIFEMSKLKFIDLFSNQHLEVKKINALNQVQRIRWKGCKEIPNEFCKLKNLKELIFDQGEIKKVPTCIGNLTNLEELKLTDQPLEFIPDELKNMRKLIFLDLSGTRISNLSNVFLDSYKGQYLILKGCNYMSESRLKEIKKTYKFIRT